ncbi:hypothetical protein L2E82_46329 [Cichorium intybus]|uniref:Uncharacterized protein n=1 Tax=Cichorium intybus TaxID=13427 RepID=A0ACB8YSX0_CICIN|nr:hypothetical protein L2E82_46329 [Cichorium intybus]
MDSFSPLPPLVKVKALPISTTPTPLSESNLIKQGQPDMTNTHTVDLPPPPFINSINELRRLSTALSTFLCRYDELNNHLNTIKSSIDSKLQNHLVYTANLNQSTPTSVRETPSAHAITVVPEAVVSEQNPNGTANNCRRSHDNVKKPENPNSLKKPEETDSSKKHEQRATPKKPEEIATCKKPDEIATLKQPEETATSKNEEIDTSKKLEEIDKSGEIDSSKKHEEIDTLKKRAVSELESLCERMCGKGIKKYVSTRISDMNKLRKELPKALKFAKDPAKLVLDSIGRFFVQGSRGFVNGSKPFVARLASVLILECFVMISSDDIEITKEHEKYAAVAAGDWKKRMITEGGFNAANEVDARGLLLLISGFGIPNHVFGNKDIRDLIMASNVKEISTALRRSIFLIQKVPDLIDWMVKSNMEIEAADLAYTLGLVDKCRPVTILMTFFHNKIKDRQHTSVGQIKHQLSDLKSLSKCLESHNIDPSKFFPDFKINEKIQQLEKETHKLDSFTNTQKRKAEPKQQEAKRRVKLPHQQSPYLDPTNENRGKLTGVYGPYVRHENLALMDRYLGQPYFPQPSLGQPYSSQPSTSALIGLYGGSLGQALMEPFPGLLDSTRRGPVSDLYGFADKVVNASYGGSHATGSGGRTHYF